MTNLKVGVLGGGSWGTTVASLVTRNAPVTIWARNSDTVEEINRQHANSKYLPGPRCRRSWSPPRYRRDREWRRRRGYGHPLPELPQVLEVVKQHIRAWVPVISLTKGLELDTRMRMTEIINEVLPGHPVGVFTGPNLAREIMSGRRRRVWSRWRTKSSSRSCRTCSSSGLFRVYTNTDVIGCELGGVLKNIIAIAVGMGDGRAPATTPGPR